MWWSKSDPLKIILGGWVLRVRRGVAVFNAPTFCTVKVSLSLQWPRVHLHPTFEPQQVAFPDRCALPRPLAPLRLHFQQSGFLVFRALSNES